MERSTGRKRNRMILLFFKLTIAIFASAMLASQRHLLLLPAAHASTILGYEVRTPSATCSNSCKVSSGYGGPGSGRTFIGEVGKDITTSASLQVRTGTPAFFWGVVPADMVSEGCAGGNRSITAIVSAAWGQGQAQEVQLQVVASKGCPLGKGGDPSGTEAILTDTSPASWARTVLVLCPAQYALLLWVRGLSYWQRRLLPLHSGRFSNAGAGVSLWKQAAFVGLERSCVWICRAAAASGMHPGWIGDQRSDLGICHWPVRGHSQMLVRAFCIAQTVVVEAVMGGLENCVFDAIRGSPLSGDKIAGSLVAALLVLAAIVIGIRYVRKKPEDETSSNPGVQMNVGTGAHPVLPVHPQQVFTSGGYPQPGYAFHPPPQLVFGGYQQPQPGFIVTHGWHWW